MAKIKKNNSKEEPIEKQLWKAADKLRKNIDAAEYKHIVMGLMFLKYISDAFEELHEKLKAGVGEYDGADPEDKDEYKAENVFFVPPSARWSFLRTHAKQPTIGKTVDEAMDAIERENVSLRDVLPKVFARGNLDPTNLGGLIDLISNIALGDAKAKIEIAKAEAQAQELLRKTISEQIIQLRAVEKWDGVLPLFVGESNGIFLDVVRAMEQKDKKIK